MIKIGSVFSGIGGFEIGIEAALNSENIKTKVCFQIEKDLYCRQVLQKHWPDSSIFSEIQNVKIEELEAVDLLMGGFPCQDISAAGKGEGLNGSRSGLFYELLRIIRELEPPVVLLENVPAIYFRGLGDVFGELASSGYDIRWKSLSASEVGFPHLRKRWFALAYSHKRIRTELSDSSTSPNPIPKNNPQRSSWGQPIGSRPMLSRKRTTKPAMGRSINGISHRLDRSPAYRGEDQFKWEPRRISLKRRKNESKRIHLLGNSIVPLQAAMAFKQLGLIEVIQSLKTDLTL
tara:strand:- start:2926 stop:3795 length:870 start_codon:yes stop_codon:yes gene_type:complete